MKLGMWVVILGVLGIIIGGVVYVYNHHIIGESGIGLGVVLLIVGIALMMMKEKPAVSQAAQPSKTP